MFKQHTYYILFFIYIQAIPFVMASDGNKLCSHSFKKDGTHYSLNQKKLNQMEELITQYIDNYMETYVSSDELAAANAEYMLASGYVESYKQPLRSKYQITESAFNELLRDKREKREQQIQAEEHYVQVSGKTSDLRQELDRFIESFAEEHDLSLEETVSLYVYPPFLSQYEEINYTSYTLTDLIAMRYINAEYRPDVAPYETPHEKMLEQRRKEARASHGLLSRIFSALFD